MKRSLALALLAATVALPAAAGTLYVSYAADEMVGGARYRTEIAVENHGSSPVQVKTRFVSSDGARHRGLTTIVPARRIDSLARAVPEGMHGRLEVTAPSETVVTARLVAYRRKGRSRSSDEELIIAESVMSPPGQTMYFRNLPVGDDAVTRMGVVLADDRGSCSLTAHGDMASGMKALASVRSTGVAAVSRDFAEPLRALRIASLAGTWLAVTCDTPALPYVAVLTADGLRASLLTPAADCPLEQQVEYVQNFTNQQIEYVQNFTNQQIEYVQNFTNQQIDELPVGRPPEAVQTNEPPQRPSPPPTPDRPPPAYGEADR